MTSDLRHLLHGMEPRIHAVADLSRALFVMAIKGQSGGLEAEDCLGVGAVASRALDEALALHDAWEQAFKLSR